MPSQSKTKIITFVAAALIFGIGSSAVSHAVSASTGTTAQVEAPAISPNVVLQGSFEGRSKHVTSGEAYIMKTASGYALVLADNFFLDGAPGPVLGFGNDGQYIKASQFADLDKKSGRQTYTLPADFTPGQFNEVYVWCEDFSVPLGVATLTQA
jgi:hypothetical protein